MLYRYRFVIIILAGVISLPFSSLSGSVDPVSDCPKKNNNSQEDSISVSDSDDIVEEDVQLQEFAENRLEREKVAEKTNYKDFENSSEDSDKVTEVDPNSAMTFNFIYYIIDKFKFTDPIE